MFVIIVHVRQYYKEEVIHRMISRLSIIAFSSGANKQN